MKCEFSETQFAFNYTFEILRRYSNLQIPFFPNTIQEGQDGGGYDVRCDFKVKGSLFLQFKIPSYIKNKNKYKIIIKNKQFEQLRDLVLQELKFNKPANLVYYVAPRFHSRDNLENFYYDNTIEFNSALFPVGEFPNLDKSQHTLVYSYTKEELHRLRVPLYELHESGPTEQFPENAHRLPSNDIEKTYGIINSEPKGIEISPYIFPKSYKGDEMFLSAKATFLINKIKKIDPNFPEKENVDSAKWLFSVLINRYNILWIPII